MGKTKIEWTRGTDGTEGFSWNPLVGCSRVSPGCVNCYAERIAARFSGPGHRFEGFAEMRDGRSRWTGKVELDQRRLLEPFGWRRPRIVFVNSMSDMFHAKLSFEQIGAVFGAMALARVHMFIVLTKRADRMRAFTTWVRTSGDELGHLAACLEAFLPPESKLRPHLAEEMRRILWPLPNVILGVSVEDQERAIERLPFLVRTPAAARMVSAEPLLAELELTPWLYPETAAFRDDIIEPAIDWVVAGAESGPGARPMRLEWARALRDQCYAARVPFFLKQFADEHGRKLSLPELDGRQCVEYPKIIEAMPSC